MDKCVVSSFQKEIENWGRRYVKLQTLKRYTIIYVISNTYIYVYNVISYKKFTLKVFLQKLFETKKNIYVLRKCIT